MLERVLLDMIEWVPCVECGEEFPKRRRDQSVCSNTCSVGRWRRLHAEELCKHRRVRARCQRCAMGAGTDRRPWLILSLREARALEIAALEFLVRSNQHAQGDLARALEQVDLQQRWIDGAADGDEPNPVAAILRDRIKENAPAV